MCKVTSASIAADGQAVATACTNIATALEATNPTLAADLDKAAAGLVAVTSKWTTGSVAADLNTAATAVETVLAMIPITAPYASFVAIAVAALDIILANVGTQAAQTGDATADALKVRTAVKALPSNPYRGMVMIHRHPLQNYRAAFVETWNHDVEAQPELEFAKL